MLSKYYLNGSNQALKTETSYGNAPIDKAVSPSALTMVISGPGLLAIRYAAWIKPDFEIKVYEVFRTVVRSGVDAMSHLNKTDLIIDTETRAISLCASQMSNRGSGGCKRLLYFARERIADEVQMYLPVLNI